MNDATLTRDPSRLADGILVTYNGGSVYGQSTATGDSYFGPGYSRDLVMPHANTSSSAVATTLTNRYLADAGSPEERIVCSYLAPKEYVNGLKEGQRVLAKFTHFPGYSSDYSWMRCLKRTVTQMSPEKYLITVELSPGGAAVASLSCSADITGADSGDFTGSSPASYASIPMDAATPGIAIGFIGLANNGTDVGSGLTLGGAFTQMDAYSTTAYDHTMSGTAYQAVSTTPGTFSASWTGAAVWWMILSVSFATNATAPVQTGTAYVGGRTITLGAAPTSGNLLVLCRIGETGPLANDPVGSWSRVVVGSEPTYGFHMDIWVRCAGAGESATIDANDHPYSHWYYLSEWVIS